MDKRIIYCDMDGVLCTFKDSFKKITNETLPDHVEKYGWAKTWKIIEQGGSKYWGDIKWNKGGKKLWKFIKGFNVEILTALPYGKVGEYATIGKTDWCNKELGDIKVNAIIGGKNKYKFIKNNDILIDDMERNCEAWENTGGIAILHTDADTTIRELKMILRKIYLSEDRYQF